MAVAGIIGGGARIAKILLKLFRHQIFKRLRIRGIIGGLNLFSSAIAPQTLKMRSPKILFLGPEFIWSIILVLESGYGFIN